MRTYTVHSEGGKKEVFEGFDHDFRTTPGYVALFNVEGEIETWAIADPMYVDNIKDYYKRDEFPAKLIGVYQCVKN